MTASADHDPSRIPTDDETFEALVAGAQFGPHDDELMRILAGGRDHFRQGTTEPPRISGPIDPYAFFASRRVTRGWKSLEWGIRVSFCVALVLYAIGLIITLTVGAVPLALASVLLAASLSLATTALGVLIPAR